MTPSAPALVLKTRVYETKEADTSTVITGRALDSAVTSIETNGLVYKEEWQNLLWMALMHSQHI